MSEIINLRNGGECSSFSNKITWLDVIGAFICREFDETSFLYDGRIILPEFTLFIDFYFSNCKDSCLASFYSLKLFNISTLRIAIYFLKRLNYGWVKAVESERSVWNLSKVRDIDIYL